MEKRISRDGNVYGGCYMTGFENEANNEFRRQSGGLSKEKEQMCRYNDFGAG